MSVCLSFSKYASVLDLSAGMPSPAVAVPQYGTVFCVNSQQWLYTAVCCTIRNFAQLADSAVTHAVCGAASHPRILRKDAKRKAICIALTSNRIIKYGRTSNSDSVDECNTQDV